MKKFNTATKNIFLGFMALLVFVAVGAGVIKVVEGFSKAQAATSCVITLFGKQYDVATLQNAHTGGNLFACGIDMTATYQAQHGTDVSRMLPYLIPDPTSTPMPTVTPAPTDTPLPTVTPPATSTGSYREDKDEIEQEEHETVSGNRENDYVKAEIKENDDDDNDNDDNDNGHHLVGANSAHGTMDNTFKKEQEEE